MSTLTIRCNHCNESASVPIALRGKVIKCHKCTKPVPVPHKSGGMMGKMIILIIVAGLIGGGAFIGLRSDKTQTMTPTPVSTSTVNESEWSSSVVTLN